MITTICGTNRPESRTLLFARYFADLLLDELGQKSQLLDLACTHHGYFQADMYDPAATDERLTEMQRRYVLDVDRLAIFVPEYNGSYPGVLKLFIDGISINDYANNFGGKRVALIGIASGRAGNLRGMDHLADVISHMGGWVMPNRLPLSNIEALLDQNGEIIDEDTKKALREQAVGLVGKESRN